MSKWRKSSIIKLLAELLFIISVAVVAAVGTLLIAAYYSGALSDSYSTNELKANLVYDVFNDEIQSMCTEFFYGEKGDSFDFSGTKTENNRLLRNYLEKRLSADIMNAEFYHFEMYLNEYSSSESDTDSRSLYVTGTDVSDCEYNYYDTVEMSFSVEHDTTKTLTFYDEYEANTYSEYLYNAGYDINSCEIRTLYDENDYETYVLEYEYTEIKNVSVVLCCYLNTAISDAVVDTYINSSTDLSASVKILGFLHDNRDGFYVLMGLSVLFILISFIISMCCAGHKKGHDDICTCPYTRAPWEINIIFFGISLCLAYIAACYLSYSYDIYALNHGGNYAVHINFTALAVSVTMFTCSIELVHILWRSIVIKLKAGMGKGNSMLIRFAKKHIGRESRLRSFFKVMFENVPFLIKAVLLYAAITLFELIVASFVLIDLPFGVYGFLLLLKLVLMCIYFVFVVQLRMLYEGGKRLASGDFEHMTDTRHMFWCFKTHGEHLNSIKEGLGAAITERMKSERMKTELITNVSHDIKTPLTSIINYVDLLKREGITDEPEASYIEVLDRQSGRLKKLIEDLVEASKASSGAMKVELEPVDVNMIVNQASAEYLDKMLQRNITLMVKNTEEPCEIMADGRHLWRVIDNLLNNAYKYAMPGTRVYVDIHTSPDDVRIVIRNISKDQLNISSDELMERFVRGDESRNTEGSGLGLSISQSLCQLMGATFRIEIDGDLFKAVISFDRAALIAK